MSDRANLVRVLTAATGNSTPITLGSAYSQLFMTTTEANMIDGRTYTWLIVDGNNWELVKGAYTASGTQMARTVVLASRSGGTLGTSRITLSGTAQVRVIESADDMGALRNTRTVTTTSDTIVQSDLGGAIIYNNASAIAVAIAQAGASSQLLDGWCARIRNKGAGTVTITPTTSTINDASSIAIPTKHGAFIWSDGTNYHAMVLPLTAALIASNNLSDIGTALTALNNLGGVSYASAQSLSTGQQDQARSNIAADQAVKGSSLVLLQRQVISNAASVVFNSTYINSTYDSYVLEMDSVLPVTDLTSFLLTISDDNGSTYKSSSYHWSRQLFWSGSATISGSNSASASAISLIDSLCDNNTGRPISGKLEFWAPGAAASRLVVFGCDTLYWSSHLSGTFPVRHFSQGSYGSATAAGGINNIKLAFSSGNISTGNFSLFARKKA